MSENKALLFLPPHPTRRFHRSVNKRPYSTFRCDVPSFVVSGRRAFKRVPWIGLICGRSRRCCRSKLLSGRRSVRSCLHPLSLIGRRAGVVSAHCPQCDIVRKSSIVAFMHQNGLETDVMRKHKNISRKVDAGWGDYVERFELDRKAHLSSHLRILGCIVLCFPGAQHNRVSVEFIAAHKEITTRHDEH